MKTQIIAKNRVKGFEQKRLGNNEQAGNKIISIHTIRDRLYVFISDCIDAVYLTVSPWDNEGTQSENSQRSDIPHVEEIAENRKGANNGRQGW
ncbi:MAG: hypothetical protein H8D23_08040 [Candidatus Brocadiales bacterium]|nr:hypothetical protein [Candidatus Brocadiales bacterium]